MWLDLNDDGRNIYNIALSTYYIIELKLAGPIGLKSLNTAVVNYHIDSHSVSSSVCFDEHLTIHSYTNYVHICSAIEP